MAKYQRGINDLETFCIENNRNDLLLEWDYEKNNGLKPVDVCYGSAKKVWWIGKCGHSFFSSLNRRTANNTGCPYCCESHAKLLTGFNDLATTNPELLLSWDYEKNGQLKPTMVMKGQHIKVWWKGECGHSWQASIYHRVQGRGCPVCRKESKSSFPEQAIFYYIRKCFPDAENGNVEVLDGKELDIFIPSINVGIEYDGKKWHENKHKDDYKNRLCAEKKINLYRIRDAQCPRLDDNPFLHIISFDSYSDDALEKIIKELSVKLCVNIDVSLQRDRVDILNQYLTRKKEQSLSAINPDLAKEWDFENNGKITPELVQSMSAKKVWWRCEKGHKWQSVISARTQGAGCPYCNSNRLLKGFNDLETIAPELLKYWSYEKNSIHPNEVTAKSVKKVWWHCPSCGNDYFSSIRNKVKYPTSCPYCTHKIPIVGVSDLKSVNPSLAKEWDYSKNGGLNPEDVTASSDKKIWWLCSKGHSFRSTVSNRNIGRGCPYCSGHKVLVGYNDFACMHPELLCEWNYKKNDYLPSSITEHSGRKAWWICSKGHEWQATIDSRSNGAGCPYCNGRYSKPVINTDKNIKYKSLRDAADACGLKSGDTISLCCKGKQKTAGGYHWIFAEDSHETNDVNP